MLRVQSQIITLLQIPQMALDDLSLVSSSSDHRMAAMLFLPTHKYMTSIGLSADSGSSVFNLI